jgi:hypothetical protein
MTYYDVALDVYSTFGLNDGGDDQVYNKLHVLSQPIINH